MPCVQLNTNAHFDAPQMPVGVPNTMAVWLRSATLGVFGELFLSETGTINATANDGIAGLDTAKFFVSRKFDGRTDAAVGGSANTWYYWVFSSEDSSNFRVRIFADDGPTFTKVADWTRAFSGTDKRYAAINASNGNIRVTGMLIHYGGVITDAEIRAQMVTRVATTPAAGTSWAAYDLVDHTDLTDTIGANDATSTGTTSTVSGDEPAAYSSSSASRRRSFVNTFRPPSPTKPSRLTLWAGPPRIVSTARRRRGFVQTSTSAASAPPSGSRTTVFLRPRFMSTPGGGGGPPDPGSSTELSFRRTPRLFGPKRVATVV